MNYIFSPWRMKYIENHNPSNGCVFCFDPAVEPGPENLIVYRGQNAFVILNRFPYTSGHVMVVPNVHAAALDLLDVETRAEMMELVNHSIQVLREVYQPGGFNLGANIGAVAGAGVADHVHLHIVPRWGGDTNFMSTVAETRVLPEDLEESYRRIRAAWDRTMQVP